MAFSVGTVEATIGANMKPFEKAMGRVRSMGAKMTQMISLPLAAVGGLALKTAADYEKLRVSMDTLNGSAEEGARNFERLKTFSAETPFQLQDLASAQNMLQGFGMEADAAFESIKMIGDISAVTGGDIQGIGVAFGQAAAEGKLMTRDIRQLINQGVPAIKLLANTMGVAQSDVLDLAEQGKISFDILQQSFKDATSEGGMFANGMQKQSQTLAGVFSTLKDNVSLALGEIGQSLNETFNITELVKKVTSGIKNIVSGFKSLSTQTRGIIFTVAGLLAAGGPIMIAISAMIPAISAIGTAFAALVSPIGLAVAAIGGLAAGVLYIWDNWKAVKERISDISWWRNAIIDMLQFLIEYSPISLMIKQLNAALSFFGQSEIPNPFEAMAGKLDKLKGDTKEYQHQFGSFTDAIINGTNALTGIDLSTIFSAPTIDNATESVKSMATATTEATNRLINMQNWFTALDNTANNFGTSANKSLSVSNKLANGLSNAFANAVVHSGNMLDNIKQMAKQLLSKGIVTFMATFLTGGIGGIRSLFKGGFGKGIGKLIGINDGMIMPNGNVVKMHPNDRMFAMKDGRTPMGGSGISEGAISRAFKMALDQKLTELSPEAVWVMGQKGRRSY